MAFYPCIKQDGNVNDVKVNGTSVVDENKVAQITSYKEVTLAEYESIPVAERESNGIAYFIKDLNNESVQGYPPLIYSDEEREVGVWRDGKPLYQKTTHISNISISANSSTNVNISDYFSDVDSAVDFECCDENGNAIFPNVMVNSGLSPYSIGVTIDKSNDHITFTRGSGSSATISVYLTLWYTKTTDTAGSGRWTTQGGLACHYSFTEHIIGTWFGETLWEKTIQYVSAGGTADTDKVIDTSIKHGTNCYVVDLQGVQTYGYLRDNNTCPKPNATSDPEPLSQSTLHLPYYGGATMASGQIYLYSDGIHFMKKGGTNNANSIILTVRYVKI